jgi:vancomycin permeability regulator SanA
MRVDDPLRVILQPAKGDKAATYFFASWPARNLILLVVGVDRGFRLRNQDAIFDPLAVMPRSAEVNVVLGIVISVMLAPYHAYEVEGAATVVARLHLRRDLIVGLGHDSPKLLNP